MGKLYIFILKSIVLSSHTRNDLIVKLIFTYEKEDIVLSSHINERSIVKPTFTFEKEGNVVEGSMKFSEKKKGKREWRVDGKIRVSNDCRQVGVG